MSICTHAKGKAYTVLLFQTEKNRRSVSKYLASVLEYSYSVWKTNMSFLLFFVVQDRVDQILRHALGLIKNISKIDAYPA